MVRFRSLNGARSVHATANKVLQSFLRRLPPLPAALALIASLGAAHAAGDTEVGSISDVEGKAESVSSGQSAGAAKGAAVHLNDELTTGADGHLQVTFRDETVLTLGEDARVVVDRYVFDPDRGVGDVLLTTTQGAFRFATGRMKELSEKNITVSNHRRRDRYSRHAILGRTGRWPIQRAAP
jgi:hypothetical protein